MILKNKLTLILILVILGMAGVIALQKRKIVQTMELYTVASNNEKASTRETDKWKDKYGVEHTRNIQYKQDIRTVETSTNNLDKFLSNTIKNSKIKKGDITSTGVITTSIDTVFRTDTITSIKDTTIDLSDQYITNVLTLKDGVISNQIAVIDTIAIIWSEKRETIKPPYKFFVKRWLQKRHTLTMVETTHSNKRVTTGEQKFILTEKNKKK